MKLVSIILFLLLLPAIHAQEERVPYDIRVSCSQSGGWLEEVSGDDEEHAFCHCPNDIIWQVSDQDVWVSCETTLSTQNSDLLRTQQDIDSLREVAAGDVSRSIGDVLLSISPYILATIIFITGIEVFRRKRMQYYDAYR